MGFTDSVRSIFTPAEVVIGKRRLVRALMDEKNTHVTTQNRIKFAAAVALLLLAMASIASAGEVQEQVCDVRADYALGIEDYPAAIRTHTELVREHPGDALAHYHLGFAEGMVGDRTAEITEYQRAEALGLRNWDLFLNLGLAQLERGDLEAATDSLRQAVSLGDSHPESHFNLALVYDRRRMLADAEREMLASLRLNPRQPDAENALGVIYAEEGQTRRASLLWREMVRETPDYAPARRNLESLGSQSLVARRVAAAASPPAVAAKTLNDDDLPASEQPTRSAQVTGD